MKFKLVENGYIVAITTNYGQIAITDSEYETILDLFRSKPSAESGFDYLLRDGTMEWELVELPAIPEPPYEPTVEDKAEAYDILMGVGE